MKLNRSRIQRLTGHVGPECGGSGGQDNYLSGSWFDPDRSGEGRTVSQIDESTAVGLWFTYDKQGEPLWLIGAGEIDGDRVQFDEMLQSSGPEFGPGFDPGSVDYSHWGSVTLESLSCEAIHTEWEPLDTAFGMGSRTLDRLTILAGLDC